MNRRRLLVLSTAGLALVAGAYLATLQLRSSDPVVEGDEVLAPGRWHLAHTAESLGSEEERRRARVMSSPYLAGSRVAEARSGVTTLDPQRSQPGLNFYVSGHAAEAHVLTNEGRPLTHWALPVRRAFPTAPASYDYWRRAQPLADGSLVAMYQGVGLVKLDRDSRLIWALDVPVFNDLEVTPDGTIYTLTKRPTVLPAIHPTNQVLEDSVTVLSAAGEVLRNISLVDALAASEHADLIQPIADAGDIFHSNTVTRLTAQRYRPFADGQLLISVREIDLIAILDLDAELITWAQRGPWSRQHEPVLLDDGSILLFDNLGARDGASRVLEVDPMTGEVTWEFDGLNSREAGSVQRLVNGNTLISESERGRALEITPDGDIVWEFWSPHRAGRSNELVATLFEVVRLPLDCCPYLSAPAQ